MNQFTIDEKALIYQEYLNRESDNLHHTHEQEMVVYQLIKDGDLRSVEESRRITHSTLPGLLSDDPVRNAKYLYVATSAIACRVCIINGMEAERSYNISDLFIQKMDLLNNIEDVHSLMFDMIAFYTKEMARINDKSKTTYSQPITRCLRFIDKHLHARITMDMLANEVGLNSSYLSTLFKKETGLSFTQYILKKKISTACNMLMYSDYTQAEISSILSFSSQSHFARAFKAETGITPSEYKKTQPRHK